MNTLSINELRNDLKESTNNMSWTVSNIITDDGLLLPPTSDSKEISKLLERQAEIHLSKIADKYGYVFETSSRQNTYPDGTLTKYDAGRILHRIAIDAKSTFEKPSMNLTLGSYTSFLLNDNKSITYPYSTYDDHWVMIFTYRRTEDGSYDSVRWYLTEKARITGLVAGSGNTKNIGSVRFRKVDDLTSINGPFARFKNMKGASDHYWRNYDRLRKEIKSPGDLIMHPEFVQFTNLERSNC